MKKRYEAETVRELTYLSDMASAGGRCKAAGSARTRCGWAKTLKNISSKTDRHCLQGSCKMSNSVVK